MNVNTKPLEGALRSSEARLEYIVSLIREADKIGDQESLRIFNELGVLHQLFKTVGEAVQELQKENNR